MKTGILLINKAIDMTSHDVISILRRKLNFKRIGHTGTLDPMATGVLPICIGNATRISEYIMNQGKTYVAEMKFGQSTTTYDSTGDIVDSSDNIYFTKNEVEKVLDSFVGIIEQTPPIYSAIKVDGKKLYEYAREGKEVKIKSRNVNIYFIELISLINDKLTFKVSCSKGTYIRTLIHDIAIKLNSFGYMTKLERVQVGKFNIENSFDIRRINEIEKNDLLNMVIDTEKCIYNLPKLYIGDDLKFRLINGQRINILTLDNTDISNVREDVDTIIFVDNEFIGIGKISKGILKMEKVLCQD